MGKETLTLHAKPLGYVVHVGVRMFDIEIELDGTHQVSLGFNKLHPIRLERLLRRRTETDEACIVRYMSPITTEKRRNGRIQVYHYSGVAYFSSTEGRRSRAVLAAVPHTMGDLKHMFDGHWEFLHLGGQKQRCRCHVLSPDGKKRGDTTTNKRWYPYY